MPTLSTCQLIPVDVVAEALGGALTKPPQPFHDDYLGDGCQYDAGKDRSGHARFRVRGHRARRFVRTG